MAYQPSHRRGQPSSSAAQQSTPSFQRPGPGPASSTQPRPVPSFRHPAPTDALSHPRGRYHPAPTHSPSDSDTRPRSAGAGPGQGQEKERGLSPQALEEWQGMRAALPAVRDRYGRNVSAGGGAGSGGRPGSGGKGGGGGDIGRGGMRMAAPRRATPKPDEMEMLASVSRSGGGADEGGDALKDLGTQERFRAYIDGKIRRYYSERGDAVNEQEALGNIVRMFRKLREGVVASHRLDAFAIEVFEDSVRYAVLAHDVPQLNAALNGLVPELYRAVDAARESGTGSGFASPWDEVPEYPMRAARPNAEGQAEAGDNRAHFASLLLLYHLVHSSRAVYRKTLEELTLPPASLRVRQWPADPSSPSLSAPQTSTASTRIPPPGANTPFISPTSPSLHFAQAAARALAPETFNPVAFAALVAGPTSSTVAETKSETKPEKPETEALDRALLAWASPSVRERAGALLRKAYLSVGVGWAGAVLGLSETGTEMWAMAEGVAVREGVVKLR